MLNDKQRSEVKNRILVVLGGINSAESESYDDHWNQFRSILVEVSRNGWTRNDVYSLLWDIMSNHHDELMPWVLDELGELETAITGYCSSNSIFRFPGDPVNADELAKVVRSGVWKEDSISG